MPGSGIANYIINRSFAMNTDVKAVHFTLREDTREYLDQKLTRIPNAENMIVDLLITLTREAKDFSAEAKVNFRWGVSIHLKENDFDLNPAIDKLMDKMDAKIIKEKEKAKDVKEKERAQEKRDTTFKSSGL
jgi:putative sigma-54 modulation protein